MGYQLNGCNTNGLPEYLIKAILDKHEVKYLVETGTASGDSARLAASMFEKVWTIEVIEERQEPDESVSNIEYLCGDSVELLPAIIKKLKQLKENNERQWVLFYLDAHYSGNTPNESGYPECPVLKEIQAISEYGEDSIIIIDDARLFFGHPPYPHDPTEWPSICEIFILLREKFPYHHITITDDYILCIPLHVREVIDKEWRGRFHIRYPNDEDKLRQQVKDVHVAFIDKLYKPFLNYIK